MVDNMETCVQEIFGEQLQSKAAECTKPGFDLLHGFLEDEGFLTKERFAEFKKCFEEACLIAKATRSEPRFRLCPSWWRWPSFAMVPRKIP